LNQSGTNNPTVGFVLLNAPTAFMVGSFVSMSYALRQAKYKSFLKAFSLSVPVLLAGLGAACALGDMGPVLYAGVLVAVSLVATAYILFFGSSYKSRNPGQTNFANDFKLCVAAGLCVCLIAIFSLVDSMGDQAFAVDTANFSQIKMLYAYFGADSLVAFLTFVRGVKHYKYMRVNKPKRAHKSSKGSRSKSSKKKKKKAMSFAKKTVSGKIVKQRQSFVEPGINLNSTLEKEQERNDEKVRNKLLSPRRISPAASLDLHIGDDEIPEMETSLSFPVSGINSPTSYGNSPMSPRESLLSPRGSTAGIDQINLDCHTERATEEVQEHRLLMDKLTQEQNLEKQKMRSTLEKNLAYKRAGGKELYMMTDQHRQMMTTLELQQEEERGAKSKSLIARVSNRRSSMSPTNKVINENDDLGFGASSSHRDASSDF